ncbi:MAG: bacteriocin [Selenomonas sp.]|nr:bacteriocin [Selenomonas sp.]
MTTREENLKKITAGLEKLSDEELEQVAGGNAEECFK